MESKTKLGHGLFAIGSIWLTAGLSLPVVNLLKMFSPEQLLAARGFLTAFMALLLAKGKVLKVDRYTYLIALCVPFASLGLFKGIRAWGAGPTIIVITATPVINFLFTVVRGRKIPGTAIASLGIILSGVATAHWGGTFNLAGFGWSVFGTFFNALLYEILPRAKSGPFQRCFWGSMGIGTIGLIGSYSADWTQVMHEPRLLAYLTAFAFVSGLLYWLANLIAFEKLPKDIASILAQGETPVVIIFSGIIGSETLGTLQWLGVLLALFGAYYLTRWLATRPTLLPDAPPSPSPAS